MVVVDVVVVVVFGEEVVVDKGYVIEAEVMED